MRKKYFCTFFCKTCTCFKLFLLGSTTAISPELLERGAERQSRGSRRHCSRHCPRCRSRPPSGLHERRPLRQTLFLTEMQGGGDLSQLSCRLPSRRIKDASKPAKNVNSECKIIIIIIIKEQGPGRKEAHLPEFHVLIFSSTLVSDNEDQPRAVLSVPLLTQQDRNSKLSFRARKPVIYFHKGFQSSRQTEERFYLFSMCLKLCP